jgi:hypothetical protein
MGYLAKLIYGTQTLNLNDGTYALMLDFRPPAPVRVVNFASGTFRNKSGGERVGVQPKDRAWAFSIRILGASAADTHTALRNLQFFLDKCNDSAETLYLEYNPSDAVSVNPTWGQSVYRYEIKDATLDTWANYSISTLRNIAIVALVTLTIGPYAIGLPQQLGNAAGGIFEDNRLAVDGISRGTVIPGVTTNLITNPIVSAAITNWTTYGAGSVISRVIDDGPIGVCSTCAELYAADVATGILVNATNRVAITAGNTYTVSVYAKCKSRSAYTFILQIDWRNAAGANISYSNSGNLTMTDSWARYSLTAAAPALTVTAYFGIIRITTGVNVFRATAAQFENTAEPTPFCYGDMLGVTWTGTAHASSSTRTAAQVRLPTGKLNPGQGSIVVGWTPGYSDDYALSQMFFHTDTVNFRGYFNATGDLFQFDDGTNTAASAAQVFTAGSTAQILIFTWSGTNGLVIYKNGSSVATSATYTAPLWGTQLWIGSTNAASGQNGGIIHLFNIYDKELTGAEALALSTDLAGWIQGGDGTGQGLGGVPWIWTDDGDGVVENHYDSGPHKNWAVAGGVPGSAEADTVFDMVQSVDFSTNKSIWISNCPVNTYLYTMPIRYDLSGTADVGNSSGDAYKSATVDTSLSTTFYGPASMTAGAYEQLRGKEYYVFARVYDAGTAMTAMSYFQLASYSGYYTRFVPVSAPSVWRTMILPSLPIQDYSVDMFGAYPASSDAYTGPQFQRTTGSAAFRVDFYMLMFRPVVRIRAAAAQVGVYYHNRDAYLYDTSWQLSQVATVSGDPVELSPGKANILLFHIGDTDVAPVISDTLALNKVIVTPRWWLV